MFSKIKGKAVVSLAAVVAICVAATVVYALTNLTDHEDGTGAAADDAYVNGGLTVGAAAAPTTGYKLDVYGKTFIGSNSPLTIDGDTTGKAVLDTYSTDDLEIIAGDVIIKIGS